MEKNEVIHHIKRITESNIVLEEEKDDTIHYFILLSNGNGIKISIKINDLNKINSENIEKHIKQEEVGQEDIELFNLKRNVYKFEQNEVIAIKKYLFKNFNF